MRNLTSFAPSTDDLLLLPSRFSQKARAFAYHYGLDDLFGRIRGPGSIIAEPTLSGGVNSSSANATKAFVQAAKTPVPVTEASIGGGAGLFTWQSWKTVGGVFTYLSSKWAIVTLLMSFLINRTQFYASSRVPLNLRWPVRLGLYLIPILSVLYQIQWLLQGIRCQTSPNWAQLRYGNPDKRFPLDYAGEGGILFRMSSTLLFYELEEASCANVYMSRLDGQLSSGSVTLLWPLFLSLCLSAFTETLSSALQGRHPVGDLNLVELSLAFAEAESMVLKPFELALAPSDKDAPLAKTDNSPLNKKVLLRAMNVSPEMLLISLLWALNNLSSMVLAIFGLRHKYRLLNTGFWGTAYFVAFSWSVLHLWMAEDGGDSWMFRLPTVFLVGFCPHVIVLIGMSTCATVYGIALLLTALSLPEGQAEIASFRGRMTAAYRNLQANVHFSNGTALNFRMSDDFYTTLLTTGFTILTAASEAVYLNEGAKVRVSNLTWLERKRIQELQQGLLFKKTRASIPSELRAAANDRIEAVIGSPLPSGYAIERKARNQEREEAMAAVGDYSNVGIMQRSGRWLMAVRFINGTFWLLLGLYAKILIFLLEKLRVAWRPVWLHRAMGEDPKRKGQANDLGQAFQPKELDFWMLSESGQLKRATDRNTDVEAEMRRRNLAGDDIDDKLYGWWKHGGWWGDLDNSGDYQITRQDDDTTSVVSTSTNATSLSGADWEDFDQPGSRTPTQGDPYPSRSRDQTPDPVFDPDQLATLLDPQNSEQHQEARMLARRLRRPAIMTRSQFRREMQQERAAVLASSRYGPPISLDGLGHTRTEEEEERLFEQFILSRRQESLNTTPSDEKNWQSGAEGMGSAGPQCVVCQDSPRTILLWPCGCLCLCDDCRVSMAARNFSSCVCCRTATVAYSRLYVP